MKILYDHQIFTQQHYGGISRYFFELIRRFDGIENSCEVATLFTENAYYNNNYDPKLKSFFPNKNFKGKSRFISTANQYVSNHKISNGNYDVFHPTYYDKYFLNGGNKEKRPFVVTFYDMIHEKFCGQFESLKNDTKIFYQKKELLEKSSKVIAISETTKNDIMEFFDVDAGKIDVVYLGSSLECFDISSKPLIAEDYILFVGNRSEYKNFSFFIITMAELLIDNNLKVVCAGGGDFTLEELNVLASLKLENRVVYKKIIDDKILSNYYAHALFFCFPSLYEGFGIPVLEAFASSCPLLLSNGGSLPEVGGDAAVYFDPTVADSLKSAASKLINDESLRRSIKEKGKLRLDQFSWDKTFQDHLKVYESVI
ncbi:glycosyltransferase family 1 protein [Flavobacterium pectinovorum]|uniref:glycosyltransferase family 4 protein n=1 Tax=Flavobacterium pectinovorum TaxID=29533 RepID=UPI00266047DC|nr:glycosyltransferase family 1 protein [Flavobacterium pectinovorum]WKL45996.1 glycosyltransferase family 1 protein [Flavobacterium pectinovorum]